MLILDELDDPAAALPLGEKLCAALNEPRTLQVGGRSVVVTVTVSASIGIARFKPNAREQAAERLMRAADTPCTGPNALARIAAFRPTD